MDRERLDPRGEPTPPPERAQPHAPPPYSDLAARPVEERAAVLAAYSRSAGNAAVCRQLARDKQPPTAADVKDLWVDRWTSAMVAEDCGTVARRMAGLLGGDKYPAPKAMLKEDLVNATPKEVEEAQSRGTKYSDRLVDGDPARYVVYSGMAGSLHADVHPILPGMLMYTAESLAWRDRERELYRWHKRHMLMYGGGGIAYENFVDARRPRDLTKDNVAYAGSLFSVGLALYDPFDDLRKKAMADEFIADMLRLGSALSSSLQRLLDKLPFQD
jgi:hypothetical protein